MAAGPTSMMESLSKVVSDISQAMVAPDADIQFLTQLQGVVVGRMRQGIAGPGQQAQPTPPPQPTPDQGAGPGGPGMMQGQPTPNGVTPLAQIPSPDELRRTIQQQLGA